MVLFKKILVLFIPFLLFSGCRKSTSANWDVDVVIPVVNSVLNISNFVNDTLFSSDPNGLLHVTINREIANLKLDSLIDLPSKGDTIDFVNTGFFPIDLNIGQAFNAFPPAELSFDVPNGVALRRADVRKGIMTVKYSNFLSQPVDLVYEITSATKNGQSFRIVETVPTGTHSVTRSYDLSGYSLNMRGISGLKNNTLVQSYTFALSTTATSSLQVMPNQGAQVEVSYSDLVPEYVEGYFGQQVIDIPLDTAKLGFAANFRASNFMLSDATMKFKIVNEFGADFSASLSGTKSINTANNAIVVLNTNQLSNINIDRATKAGSTITPKERVISFTSSNSNITSFISNLPDKLTYKGSVIINPPPIGNMGYNDFAFYNTGIRIFADINIPLKFTADYFELQSNAKVDFANVDQLNNVNNGSFVIAATNGFPFSVRLQGYMYDENNLLIDSLFVPGANIIDAGIVNHNNEVVSPTSKRILVPVTKTKTAALRRTKTIKVISRFVMPTNPPDIGIFDSYEVKVNIIAQLNYNVGLDN